MADDVNSNNRPINGKTVDPRVDEILRAEQRKEEASRRAALEKQESRIKLSKILDPGDEGAQEVAAESASQELEADVNKIQSTARNQKTKQILTLGRQSRIEREITHMAQGSEAYMAGSDRRVQIMSSTQRQYQISGLREKIESGYADIANMAARGASHEEILAASGPLSEYKKRAAALERGGKEAALKGLSEDRLIKRAEKLEEEHTSSQKYQKIKEEARAGGKGDLAKVTEDYNKSVADMVAANVKLKNLLVDETDAKESSLLSEKERAAELVRIGDLVSKAKDTLSTATKNMETAGIVKKEVEDAPSWWDQNFGAKGKFTGPLQFAKLGAQFVGDAAAGARELMYSSEMRKGSTKANVIDETNQLYFKSKQAIKQGNVSSALDVMDSITASRYADEKASEMMIPNVASGGADVAGSAISNGVTYGMLASGAAIVTGGAMVATGFGAPIGAALIANAGNIGLAAAGAGAIAGAVQNSGNLTDSVNGTAGIKDRLQAYNTIKNLSAADRAIKTDQMQSYYSFGKNLYGAAQGLGGGGAELQNQLMYFAEATPAKGLDITNLSSEGRPNYVETGGGGYFDQSMGATTKEASVLDQLAATGIDEDMAARLMPMFKSAGAFRGSDAVEVMKKAGVAGQKGILGREEYVGMATQLMGAGGGAGDLQKTLEFAVSKGMDNSKSISEMVQATLSMSSDLADIGVSGTAASSEALMNTISAMNPKTEEEKNLAVRAAQYATANVNMQLQDRSVNLGNIVETDILSKALQGTNVGVYGREKISKMGMTEWSMLSMASDPNLKEEERSAAKQRFKKYTDLHGITQGFFDANGNINTTRANMIRESSAAALINKGMGERESDGSLVSENIRNKLLAYSKGGVNAAAPEWTALERQIHGGDLEAWQSQFKGARSKEEREAATKAFDAKTSLKGADSEKTSAEASAEMIKLGKEFADTLNDSIKPAFEKIEGLMTLLKEEYIAGGAVRSKQAGDTGKIAADLTTGASQFKTIIEATAIRANQLGIEVDLVPSTRASGSSGDGG